MSDKNSKIIVYLSLGSNIGDRVGFLENAERLLNENGMHTLKKSQIYETEPWDDGSKGAPSDESGQMWFLNQVIKSETSLKPDELLKVSQEIEKQLGRTKKHHFGPREIDIDILLYGDMEIDTPELTIPHRHMYDRQFVLVPLVEIESDLKDPASGKPFSYFLKNIKDEHKVETYF